MNHRTLITTAPHRFDCPFGADEPYTLLMIYRDPGVIALDKQRIAHEIGATQCSSFCVWGHDAQAWELAVDKFCVEMEIFCGIDRMILTSEHSDELLEDAVFFATTVAPGHGKSQGRVLIWFMFSTGAGGEDTAIMDQVLNSHYVRVLPAGPESSSV